MPKINKPDSKHLLNPDDNVSYVVAISAKMMIMGEKITLVYGSVNMPKCLYMTYTSERPLGSSMRGFMQPVGMDTIEYYWRQGWPKSLLLTLLISRIEFGAKKSIESYPPDKKQYTDFKNFLRNLLYEANNPLVLKKIEGKKVAIGPSFDSSTMKVADIKALTDVTSMPNVSVEFDKDTSKYQLYKTQNYFALCKKESCEASKSENSSSFLAIQQGGSPSSEVVLRSPEGIIYFLGEVVRAELDDVNNVPMVDICGPDSASDQMASQPAKLFYVREATAEDTDPYLSVTYDGKRYVIPRLDNDSRSCEGQRTMHVLSLVEQLIALQKSSKDMPTTATVRLIQ